MKYTVPELARLAGFTEKRVWDLLKNHVIPTACDSRTLQALRGHALRGKVARVNPFPTMRG